MKTVWKFPLALAGEQRIDMPAGARLLSVQPQGEGVCLWALCDPDAKKEPRVIVIVGTGHQAPEEDLWQLKHISTFQLHGGALVFHAFEIVRAPQ